MIELTPELLKKLHQHELDMLMEVHRICTLVEIKYIIIAGTLLGAVRHGGFIPWDDDADIALLRSEYERFRIACETHLNHDLFYFQDHRNTPGYRWGYGKLRKKNTLFLREYQSHLPYEQGVFLDIFPVDYVPEQFLQQKICQFRSFCVRKLLWSEVGQYAHPVPWKRGWFKFLTNFFGDKVFIYYDNLVKSYQKETSLVKCLTFPSPKGEYGYQKEWYTVTVPILFEGVELSTMADYEHYLTFKFGDYMKLPSKEQQHCHPVTEIDV